MGRTADFMGRAYSAARRGPAAALKRALEVVALCQTVDDFEVHRQALDSLTHWLVEIGQPHKADELTRAVALRSSQLANAEQPEDARVDSPTPQAADDGADLPQESLRELCRRAEDKVGRAAVMAAFTKHGVVRIKDVGDREPQVRASVMELLLA